MKLLWIVPLFRECLLAVVQAGEQDKRPSKTTAGWVKRPKNAVLGGPCNGSGLRTGHSLGSTGSLSRARTPKTHSWTRRSGSLRTNRSNPSTPRANSPRARDRL
jgi:hypothetical protein